MGQRHQIFVIARVRTRLGKPAQYRCIAALHHQWCYGKLPLYGANAFKHLARRKDNALLIQAELARYADSVEKAGANYPCPYTSFLAECAFGTDIAKDMIHLNDAYTLDATMGSSESDILDNDDGITVLDVTVPENPQYCFVSLTGLDGPDGPDIEDVPVMTPLTATQYLRSYYPARENEDEDEDEDKESEILNLEAIANLDDMPVIHYGVLEQVWKNEYGAPTHYSYYEDDSEFWESGLEDDDIEDDAEGILSLLQQIRLNDEEVSQLVTDITSQPTPPSGSSIASTQLSSVLAQLGESPRLDVSGNAAVDKEVFVQILKTHKALKWINVCDCSISVDDLKDVLANQPELFHYLEVIIHPAAVTKKGSGWPNAFGIVFRRSYLERGCVSMPFFTTDQVVQNLTDLLKILRTPGLISRINPTNIAAILACTAREQGQDWRDRDMNMLPHISPDGLQGQGGYYFLFRPDMNYNKPEEYGIVRFKKQKEGQNVFGIAPEGTQAVEASLGGMMEIIDMATFLKELEEVVGRPPPTNPDAAKQLIEFCKPLTLLTDVKAFL